MAAKMVFTIGARVDNVRDFETFARLAARLKKHGRVEIGLNNLSGKAWYDVPKGGSSWHDYTTYQSTLLKFFPHPKIAPFVDAKYVRKNQQLLRSCARVMRKHRLDASFDGHEPFYIAEEFFARYPHLRGARVDHPRRSRQEAYAMCVDQPEAQQIIAWMMKRLVKEVPELTFFAIHSNDAGAGLCWGEYIYSGPNGPGRCRSKNAGERIASLVGALKRGAGRDLDFSFEGMLTKNECDILQHYVDERFHLCVRDSNPGIIRTGTLMDNPIQGLFDPAAIVDTLAKTQDPRVKRIRIGFTNNYARTHNDPEAAGKVIDLISAFFDKPAYKRLDRLNFLAAMCAKWAGERHTDDLFDALMALHDVLAYKKALDDTFFLNANYLGVSMRLINRPLVVIPEKLTPREEAYFLPHVFNIRESEARSDYLDLHGTRFFPPVNPMRPGVRIPEILKLCSMLNSAADSLEALKGGRALDVFRRLGTSLRIYSCVIRSLQNFSAMQILRDRNKEKLYAPQPLVPSKVMNWTGEPDLQQMVEIMRDELDNTDAFIDILANGGLSQVALAKDARLEDTFLLGPNFPQTLKEKRRIMRRHWTDAAQYMAWPLK